MAKIKYQEEIKQHMKELPDRIKKYMTGEWIVNIEKPYTENNYREIMLLKEGMVLIYRGENIDLPNAKKIPYPDKENLMDYISAACRKECSKKRYWSYASRYSQVRLFFDISCGMKLESALNRIKTEPEMYSADYFDAANDKMVKGKNHKISISESNGRIRYVIYIQETGGKNYDELEKWWTEDPIRKERLILDAKYNIEEYRSPGNRWFSEYRIPVSCMKGPAVSLQKKAIKLIFTA